MDKKSLPIIIIAFLAGIGFLFLIQNKDNLIRKTNNQAGYTEEEAKPTPQPTPTPTQLSFSVSPTEEESNINGEETDKFDNWSTYLNEKYNYQFRYDSSWLFNSQPPGSEKDDRIVLQGDISNKGWPNVGINLQHFDPMPTTITELKEKIESTLGDWGSIEETTFGNNIPAVLHKYPKSPQAYSSWNYYFLHNGKIFLINMTDVEEAEAVEIYQNFLNNFKTL